MPKEHCTRSQLCKVSNPCKPSLSSDTQRSPSHFDVDISSPSDVGKEIRGGGTVSRPGTGAGRCQYSANHALSNFLRGTLANIASDTAPIGTLHTLDIMDCKPFSVALFPGPERKPQPTTLRSISLWWIDAAFVRGLPTPSSGTCSCFLSCIMTYRRIARVGVGSGGDGLVR
jgi:hypothetical protein